MVFDFGQFSRLGEGHSFSAEYAVNNGEDHGGAHFEDSVSFEGCHVDDRARGNGEVRRGEITVS